MIKHLFDSVVVYEDDKRRGEMTVPIRGKYAIELLITHATTRFRIKQSLNSTDQIHPHFGHLTTWISRSQFTAVAIHEHVVKLEDLYHDNEKDCQEYKMSLSSETIVEILRHFTRRELCRKFYLVSRQFHDLSASRQVPAIQIVKQTYLQWKADQREQVPWHFIRFQNVTLTKRVCQDESMLKLLPLAYESFIGCKLTVSIFPTIGPWEMVPDVQNQMRHLMENVFCKLSSVMFHNGDYWLKSSSQVLHTKGISNCNKLGFFLDRFQICIEDTIRVLRDWLQNSINHQNESSVTKKRLILRLISRPAVLKLAQQLKQEFEEEILPRFEFVITFIQQYHDDGALSENEVFSITNSSTNMNISLFNCKWPNGSVTTCFSRLWHRRIVSKDEDSAMFSLLEVLDNEDYI